MARYLVKDNVTLPTLIHEKKEAESSFELFYLKSTSLSCSEPSHFTNEATATESWQYSHYIYTGGLTTSKFEKSRIMAVQALHLLWRKCAFPEHHTMKAYWGSGGTAPPIL
jgi:hypothetical protein